ncbi:MAG: methyltransferase, partial [Verrucomicrobiaceae bacterium]
EELIEGRISLYDESGRPCVLVDGFRAVSMSNVRRAGSSGGTRDLVYNVDWERTAPTVAPSAQPPLALAHLGKVAGAALEEVISLRGRSHLEAVMHAEDALAAAQIAAGLREIGVDGTFSADSLGIAPIMRTVFTRLMDKLAKRGLLTASNGSWTVTREFSTAAESAPSVLKDFLTSYPGHLPEALLCTSTCGEFGPIVRGEKDAVQVLFGGTNADLLDHFYGDGLFSSHWMVSIGTAVREAARSLPEGRGLRILEVGAGTGGLAAQVLPLLDRGLHSYTFTDVSAGFFSAANQKLAAFTEVEYKVFDLEKSPLDQDFEAGSYDFIIGTNVLHAVADVRATLKSLHELLVPGGTLMFMDVATPQLWTESVFGLTQGWWHLTDKDLRPEQPLMQRAQWEAALKEVGFAETLSLPGFQGPEGEGQIGILGRKGGEVVVETAVAEIPVETSWVIFADESGL